MRKILPIIERINYRIDKLLENNWLLFLVITAILTAAFMLGMDAAMVL